MSASGKSCRLAVNKDTGGQRGKGKYDQQAAEYHSQPNAR